MRIARGKTEPLVSVVMAVYNGESFLRQQIESILNQDYSNLEIIVVDDNSTDNSPGIICEYQKVDSRIRIHKTPVNKGAIATFEYGLLLARGEYVVLSDQDDIFDKDKISTLLDAFEEHPDADLVHSDLRLIDENNKIITYSMWKYQNITTKNGKPFRQLLYVNFVTGCSCMIRKRLLISALPFPSNCIVHDWWLAVIASSERNGGIFRINKPLVSYRQHTANVIGSHSGSVIAAIQRVPNLTARVKWYQTNVNRLKGYLDKDQICSKRDIIAINDALLLFSNLRDNNVYSVIKRLSFLPERLKYSMTQHFSHSLDIFLFTVIPKYVEWVQGLMPFLKAGSKARRRDINDPK
jgi:glycosyltransferase involved in cell wall biosynthesis